MIITYKIKYSASNDFYVHLAELRRQQSNCVRTAFNRLQEGKTQTDLTTCLKGLNGVSIDSWFKQSAVYEAKNIFSAKGQQKIVFGGKKNLFDYLKGLVTKDDFKQKRLMPLTSIGEALQKGNRKFRLDVLNNVLKFQDSKGKIKFDLHLEHQHGERQRQMLYIEDQTNEKKLPLTVKVDEKFVYLMFEPKKNELTQQITNRVFGIDLNPNSIGWSVCDIENNEPKMVDCGVIELKALNEFADKNKKHFEAFEISKFLVNKAKHHKCSTFVVEELNIKSKDNQKGRKFNKTVNNDWIRNDLLNNIKKRCWIDNIKHIEVNPAFTSIIGGTLHRDVPDPIAPTLEICRRGYFKYQKGLFYPTVPDVKVLNEQWKQTLECSLDSWRQIADWLKNAKYRYRVSLDSFKSSVFRFKSAKSYVNHRFLYI